MRAEGRRPDELRPITIHRHFNERPAGSVLIACGKTKVLCTACVEDRVPPFLVNSGKGWVTGEYAMLPGATEGRKPREGRTGKPDSRGIEISRFIGRIMRGIIDLKAIPDRTVWLDCDVLQADGGTRTAAISGAYVALVDALKAARVDPWPLSSSVAAVSVGVVRGRCLLDLDYPEDSRASVDLNVAMTGEGKFVEIQGTAEAEPFGEETLGELLRLARLGIASITAQQGMALQGTG